MSDFWNERYAMKQYVYGEMPNKYFAGEIKSLKGGKWLFPAEGEGRNAVYAASLGFDVYAFDPSNEGRAKALKLAEKNHLTIHYQLASYDDFQYEKNSFDGLVLIFAHMPPQIRQLVHHKLLECLKPGGHIIFQGFSKEQVNRNSGGPKKPEMLFSREELMDDFASLSKLEIEQSKVSLDEGDFHKGTASVIHFHGIK